MRFVPAAPSVQAYVGGDPHNAVPRQAQLWSPVQAAGTASQLYV